MKILQINSACRNFSKVKQMYNLEKYFGEMR